MPESWALLKMSHSDPLEMSLKKTYSSTRLYPIECLDSVLDGKVDFAMVSLVSYLTNKSDLTALPAPVISFSGQTLSTLLVSEGPSLQRNMKIAVSAYTRTTRWYLDVILKAMKVEHEFVLSDRVEADDLLTEAEYALVIGDEALKVFSGTKRILLDIGFEFKRNFEFDPLYAVSVSRTGEKPEEPNWFREAPGYFESCASNLADRLGISKDLAKRYYSNLRYTLDNRSSKVMEFVSRNLTGI